MRWAFSLLLWFSIPLGVSPPQPAQPLRFDVVIRNGRVMDGTGNPWRLADIGIHDGRIAALGRVPDAAGARVIDAARRLVVPSGRASPSSPRVSPPSS
jgi:urease alpha subunit